MLTIYQKIAVSAIMTWEKQPKSEATRIATMYTNWRDLDATHVYGKESIMAFCEAWVARYPYQDISASVLFSYVVGDLKKGLPVYNSIMKYKEALRYVYSMNSDNVRCNILLMLEAVHKMWIHNNTKKLVDPMRLDRIYMFLPLSLFGTKRVQGRDHYQDVMADYLFGKPIVDDLIGDDAVTAESMRTMYKTFRAAQLNEVQLRELLYKYWQNCGVDANSVAYMVRYLDSINGYTLMLKQVSGNI